MSGARPEVRNEGQIPQPAHVPRLLVELPSWRQVFFANLRDRVSPPQFPPLELRSAPAPFWSDVFVKRPLPWNSFLKSLVYHVVACALLIGLTRFVPAQPQAKTYSDPPAIYRLPSEYLPPIDTRSARAAHPAKADPEFSRQPIISVPREADNRSQTVVAPPNVKLKRDLALPNIVKWSDATQKPQLDIPAAQLTLAADISRIAPRMQNSVVAPPPDAAQLTHQRDLPTLQNSVVAPPSDLHAGRTAINPLQPALIAPPPSVDAASSERLSDRNIGALNIGHSAVIAPAPQLALAEQRAARGGGLSGPAQFVPPPPLLSASASSGQSSGARGGVIALNLHPVVGAPPEASGNRRGSFAATTQGHAGASGTPGSTANTGKEDGSGSNRKAAGNIPSGLYVGSASAKTSPVAGDPAGKSSTNSVNPNLMASLRQPRVSTAPARPTSSDSAAKLSEAERAVFGDRKFYSLTLNMPNLNSTGGSWVVRFAERKQPANNHDSASRDSANPTADNRSGNPDADASSADLSQPMATRKVDPAYPMQLMKENVAGTVILYAIIHADGTVGNVRVLRGIDDRLDRFASQAVAQWQFQPATKNGAPVDVEATFQIPFRPAHVGTNF